MGVSINQGLYPGTRHRRRGLRGRAQADVVHRAVYRRIRKMYDHLSGFGHLLIMGQAGFLDHEETVKGMTLFAGESLSATPGTAGEWVSDGQAQDRGLLGTHGHDSELGATGHQQQGAGPTRSALAPESRRQPDALRRTPAASAWPPRSPCTSSSFSAHPLERDAA